MADKNKIQDSSSVEEGTNRETTFMKNTDETVSVRNHYLFKKLKNNPACGKVTHHVHENILLSFTINSTCQRIYMGLLIYFAFLKTCISQLRV